VNQVPAVLRLIEKAVKHPNEFWETVHDVLDFGGGRFDTFTEVLADLGVRNFVYDPYNRSAEHNQAVASLLEVSPADIGICSNVLNVIKEPEIRQHALREIRDMVRPGSPVFITVNEGDRSSRGRKTSRGWQSNRPTKNYLREVRKVFPNAQVHGKLIITQNMND